MATGRWRGTWRGLSGPRARDVVVVLLCALNTLVQAWALWTRFGNALAIIGIGLGVVATVAMWWRRAFPVTVLAIAASTFLVSQVLIPVLFGLLTVAIRRRDRVLIGCTAGVALCLIAPSPTTQTSLDWQSVLAGGVAAVVFALWGAYVGARRDLVSSLRERAVRAEAERELRAEQARLAERSRIAREMHDVLAHKVSLIALQAGGLEVNPGVGADKVEQSAGLIRSTAREALEELREVLGVLRADQPAGASGFAQLTPQPGVTDIAALVESSRAAGVRVTLALPTFDGLPNSTMPLSTGRTVYRVVQEALTNVHKHARAAATDVAITSAGGVVRVTVTNQRPVSAGTLLPGSGAGLIGLRERIALQGGSLTAGPTGEGGWQVDVRLPVGPAGIPGAAAREQSSNGQDTAWLAS